MIPINELLYHPQDLSLVVDGVALADKDFLDARFSRDMLLYNHSVLADLATKIKIKKGDVGPFAYAVYTEAAASFLNLRKSCIISYWQAFEDMQKPFTREYRHEAGIEACQTFMIYAKSALDAWACLVKVLLTENPKRGKIYADIKGHGLSPEQYPAISGVLREITSSPWFRELERVRNGLVHHGYSLAFHNTQAGKALYLSKTNIQLAGPFVLETGGHPQDRVELDLIACGFFTDLPAQEDLLLDLLYQELGDKVIFQRIRPYYFKELNTVDLKKYS